MEPPSCIPVITIRPATKDDLCDVLNMIQELADFEKMPNGPKLTKEILVRDGGFDQDNKDIRPFFYTFIAQIQDEESKDNCKNIGYAMLYFCYSTWEGKAMFLEDLYVKPEYRKFGAGQQLYKHSIQFALDNGCSRFDFHVLKWNPARTFYFKMGATNLTEIEDWELFRMNQKDMKQAVTKL